MARYILIDNHSGYIWGDSGYIHGGIVTGTPVEVAAALDASVGATGREYEECHRRELTSSCSGYHVYRADIKGSEAVPVVHDGQDSETIAAVLRDCIYWTSIRCIDGEA